MAIMRKAKGFVAIWGICRNSSRSIDPEPSLLRGIVMSHYYDTLFARLIYLSSFINRFLSRSNSGCVTFGERERKRQALVGRGGHWSINDKV